MLKGESDQKVIFNFTKDTNDKDKLVIYMEQDGDTAVHTKACIHAILSFIDSNDYSGLGYDIYNNAYQYGNYNYGNNNFYYILSSEKEIENGIPPIRFEILAH